MTPSADLPNPLRPAPAGHAATASLAQPGTGAGFAGLLALAAGCAGKASPVSCAFPAVGPQEAEDQAQAPAGAAPIWTLACQDQAAGAAPALGPAGLPAPGPGTAEAPGRPAASVKGPGSGVVRPGARTLKSEKTGPADLTSDSSCASVAALPGTLPPTAPSQVAAGTDAGTSASALALNTGPRADTPAGGASGLDGGADSVIPSGAPQVAALLEEGAASPVRGVPPHSLRASETAMPGAPAPGAPAPGRAAQTLAGLSQQEKEGAGKGQTGQAPSEVAQGAQAAAQAPGPDRALPANPARPAAPGASGVAAQGPGALAQASVPAAQPPAGPEQATLPGGSGAHPASASAVDDQPPVSAALAVGSAAGIAAAVLAAPATASVPVPSSPATPGEPARHPMPTPAPDQLRSAFAAASASASAGPAHLVVRLDPAELGRVQVGITRQPDGPARIELLAERPDTLQLLMRDQPALHRALDQAGVPAEGRLLHFQLGTPEAGRDSPGAGPSWSGPSSGAAQPGGGPGAGPGAGMGGQPHGGPGGQSGGRGPAQGWGGPASRTDQDAAFPVDTAPRRTFQSRRGVDITA